MDGATALTLAAGSRALLGVFFRPDASTSRLDEAIY